MDDLSDIHNTYKLAFNCKFNMEAIPVFQEWPPLPVAIAVFHMETGFSDGRSRSWPY